MSMQRIWYIGNSRVKLIRVLSALSNFLIRPTDDYELVIRPHKRARSAEQPSLLTGIDSSPSPHITQLGKCPCGAEATVKVGGKPRCGAHIRGYEVAA